MKAQHSFDLGGVEVCQAQKVHRTFKNQGAVCLEPICEMV